MLTQEQLMDELQGRVDVLDRLIGQVAQQRWTVEEVLRADRRLLTEAMMALAEQNTDKEPS